MFFLNPTYLWALLGLLIPMAIHLWSKKEGKTIKVGSIELLRESESKQTSSIQPNELLLLMLRMFIIALVVFILAEPQLTLQTDKTAITYLIEPSLVKNEKASSILNSIDDSNTIKLLKSGFPYLDDVDLEGVSTETLHYWQLAKELQTIDSDSIVIYTKALASGFKGMRPTIHKNIEWILIDAEENTEKLPIKATKTGDTIEVLSMNSNSEHTSFDKKTIKESEYDIQGLNVDTESPIHILLFYEEAFDNDSKYLEASLMAASKHINRTFNVSKTQDSNVSTIETFDLVIWLSESNQAPKDADKLLEFKSDNLSNTLIEESSTKNHYYLTAHLITENSIENHLPELLLRILDLNAGLKDIIYENDKRTVSKAELLPTFSETTSKIKATNYVSISKWLWLILGIALLSERFIANYRKQ